MEAALGVGTARWMTMAPAVASVSWTAMSSEPCGDVCGLRAPRLAGPPTALHPPHPQAAPFGMWALLGAACLRGSSTRCTQAGPACPAYSNKRRGWGRGLSQEPPGSPPSCQKEGPALGRVPGPQSEGQSRDMASTVPRGGAGTPHPGHPLAEPMSLEGA